MTIATALVRVLLSAFYALLALLLEFLIAGLFNWVGFAWPLRMLLDPGQNLYWFLVERGFYAYSSRLFVDTGFALKFDWVLNFLLFVWLFFSFPSLLKGWSSLGESRQGTVDQHFWMK